MSTSLLGMALVVVGLGNPEAMRCRVGALHVDYNPERVWPVEDVRRSVRDASAVVRAVATRFDPRPLTPGSEPGWGTVHFRVLETINGTVPAELAFEGRAVAQDDFNGGSVPYRFVRRAGTYGDCFAREYRIGAEYLFLLKDQAGVLSPHWWALGPTNEQIRGEGDPWVAWVRTALASSAVLERASVPSALASPRLLMFHGQPLAEARFVTTPADIATMLHDRTGPPVLAQDLVGRPFIVMTLFWDNRLWERYATSPELLRTLEPEDAARSCAVLTCTGRYYPAFRGQPALLYNDTYGIEGEGPSTRRLGPGALDLARRLGLPLELD